MKISHFFFLVLLLPLTGCGLFGDPPPPTVYYTYGNDTDETIIIETFKTDETTKVLSFAISPGGEYSLFSGSTPWPLGSGRSVVIVSSGKRQFIQRKHDFFYPYYLFENSFYQEIKTPQRIYYKYVFTDFDFSEESGNNITEVPN